MSYLKVKGYQSLVRARSSGYCKHGYKWFYQFICKVREAKKSNDELKYAVREINNLKAELTEIKDLLGKLVK